MKEQIIGLKVLPNNAIEFKGQKLPNVGEPIKGTTRDGKNKYKRK